MKACGFLRHCFPAQSPVLNHQIKNTSNTTEEDSFAAYLQRPFIHSFKSDPRICCRALTTGVASLVASNPGLFTDTSFSTLQKILLKLGLPSVDGMLDFSAISTKHVVVGVGELLSAIIRYSGKEFDYCC